MGKAGPQGSRGRSDCTMRGLWTAEAYGRAGAAAAALASRRMRSPITPRATANATETARDVDLEDLAGPLVEAHGAHESCVALDPHLGHVAVAAEDLDGAVGDPA